MCAGYNFKSLVHQLELQGHFLKENSRIQIYTFYF